MVTWDIEKDYCNEDFMYHMWLTYRVIKQVDLTRFMRIEPWQG